MMISENRRILIIDDNRAIHADFQKIFAANRPRPKELSTAEAVLFGDSPAQATDGSFEIDSVFQGEEGLNKVREANAADRPYAVAFVDIRMPPGWDGIETIARLWELAPDLQIVICTAYSDYSWQEIAGKLLISDNLVILKKPFDNVEVLQLAHALTKKWVVTRQAQVKLTELQSLVETRARELERANNELRQAQKMEAVGQLAGGVAHDFNNILTAIMGYSELLLRRSGIGDLSRKRAQQIIKAATRGATLIRQLLAFSRKQPVWPQLLDLNAAVSEVEGLLRPLMRDDVDLVIKPATTTACVRADAGQVEQVIMNLALNARDAMPEGGTLSIETSLVDVDVPLAQQHQVEPGKYVALSVADNGIGIRPEDLPRIFEPFFTTKETGQGTGLGLATCYGIVRQSGGYIDVKTQLGKGTSFTVFLPWLNQSPERPLRGPETAPLPRGSETVLVAEDEDAVRELTIDVLRDLGYQVLEARDGEEAQRILADDRELDVDLVVTDLGMPRMDGARLAEWVEKIRPKTKLIFISGYIDNQRDNGAKFGQHHHLLEKPFTPTQLAAVVRETLDASAKTKQQSEFEI
jgi:two-component system NtrC family sensor kinase